MIHYMENHYPERSELTMTLADIFKEEGRKEGYLEGKTKACANTAVHFGRPRVL